MENYKTKILKNSTINFIGWLISLAVSFLTIPFFIKILTTEGYGAWVIVSSITGYFSLVQLGIGPAVIKFIAEFKAKNDIAQIQYTTNAAILFSGIVGVAGGFCIFYLSPYIVKVFNFPPLMLDDIIRAFRIGGIFFPVFLLSNVYHAVFVGYQRYDISNIIYIVRAVLTAIIGWILIVMGYGVAGMVMSTALVNSLTVIICQLFLNKLIPGYKIRTVSTLETLRKIFGYSVYTFISQMAQLLNSRLGEILIGILIGPSAVTYFYVPVRLITLFASGSSSFTTVLFPFSSELQSEGNIILIKQTFLKATRYFSFLIVPFYFIFIIFSKPILELWLSTEIAKASSLVMSIYALAYLVSGMTTVPSQYLQGFGKVKFISQFSVGIIFVSVLAYFPLIKKFGLIGAGYAVLISQVFGVLFIIYSLKMIRLSVREYLHSNIPAFLFGLIALVPVLILQMILGSYLREMYMGLILMTLFFIVYSLLCFFYSDVGLLIKTRVKSALHWRLN